MAFATNGIDQKKKGSIYNVESLTPNVQTD